jgi:hypothetical protein
MKTHVTGVLALMFVAIAGLSVPAAAQPGPREGIKVHGRWTIEVRNPDGTLASRHEFNNSLVVSGGAGSGALVGLLGRAFRGIRQWQIGLNGPADQENGPCGARDISRVFEASCRIEERLDGGAPAVGDLTVTVPGGLPHLVLSGAIRTTTAVPIVFVQTVIHPCFDAACSVPSLPRQFTSHQLATPIDIAPNQLIDVTVVLSFS